MNKQKKRQMLKKSRKKYIDKIKSINREIERLENTKMENIAIPIFLVLTMIFAISGLSLNKFVIYKNDGRMPVLMNEYENMKTDKHFSFHNYKEVKYPILADILQLKIGERNDFIYSFGDLLILFSFLFSFLNLLAVGSLFYKERRKLR